MKKIFAMCLAIIVMATLFAGCGVAELPVASDNRSNYEKQADANEDSAKAIVDQYGTPTLNRSQDYENVVRRAEYLNQANNLGYLYLLTQNGQLIREIQVMGKVTSLNSYITPMEEVVKAEGGHYYGESKFPGTYVTVQAPDIDGTYGENVNGIFWFDADGVYGEWPGLYLFSAERLTFTDSALLITVD